mgnify:FL=1
MTALAGFSGSMGGIIAASSVGLILEITNSYYVVFMVAAMTYVIAWLLLRLFVRYK